MEILYGQCCDRGVVKENNEDSCDVFFDGRLMVVADGMGGGSAGEYASRQAVEQIKEVVKQAKYYVDGKGVLEQGPGRAVGKGGLDAAFQHANTFLYSMSRTQAALQGMGTTAVCCLVEGDKLYFANVGDSRAYLLRQGQLRQVTRDHSMFSDPKYDKSNVITRAMGRKSYAETDVIEQDLAIGDGVLLCSDGLNKVVSDEEIRTCLLADAGPEEIAEALVGRANTAGGPDNIAVVYATIQGPLETIEGETWQPAVAPVDEEDGYDQGSQPSSPDFDETLVISEADRLAQAPEPSSEVVARPRSGKSSSAQPAVAVASWPRRTVALAVVAATVLLLAIAVVSWLKLGRDGVPLAEQRLVVEAWRLDGEETGDCDITVSRGDQQVWAARLSVGSNSWAVGVTYPESQAGSEAALGEPVTIRMPASVTGNAILAVGDQDGVGFFLEPTPVSQLWNVSAGEYRVVVWSSEYQRLRQDLWQSVVDNDNVSGQGVLAQLGERSGPNALEATQAWYQDLLARRQRLAQAAQDLDQVVASETIATDRFELAYKDVLAAANTLATSRGAGPAMPAEGLLGPGLFESAERIAEIRSALSEAEKLRADLRRATRPGMNPLPTTLEDQARRFTAIFDQAGLEMSEADQDLLRQPEPEPETVDPEPSPTAAAVASKPTRPGPTHDRGAELIKSLGRLREDLLATQMRHSDSISDPEAFAGEVTALRRRCVRDLGSALDLPNLSDSVRTAVLDAAVRWSIFEYWLSNTDCQFKPDKKAIALFARLGQISGDLKPRFAGAKDIYERCEP